MLGADGTWTVDLTNHPARDWMPVASPDGTRIAFTSARDGSRDIYVMNGDGSGLIRLTDDPAVDESPTWSPLPETGG